MASVSNTSASLKGHKGNVIDSGIETKKTEFDTAPTVRGTKTKKSGAGGTIGGTSIY